MVFDLNKDEIDLLKIQNIEFDPIKNYSEDEATTLLENIRSGEVEYAQGTKSSDEVMYLRFCYLGDKVFNLVENCKEWD